MRAATSPSLIGLGVAALLAAARAAAGDFGGSATLASDYVYHGLSRTCGAPAVQAGLQFRSAGGEAPSETYVGAWASMGLGRSLCRSGREIDLFAGQRLAVNGSSSITLGYVHYAFPGGSYLYEPLEGHRFDYDELAGTWALQDRLFLTLAWTPNAIEYRGYGIERGRSALSFGAQLNQPIGSWLTLSAGAGYDEVNDPSGAGYAFWNAGLGGALGPVQLAVSYFRTSARAERLFGAAIAGGRVAATALWRF
jgi:uncharacterized protein (TIGR02001 family)